MGESRSFQRVSEHVLKCVLCFFFVATTAPKLTFWFLFVSLGNLFIAGTSCKDFSMLKSSHRKGTSTTDSMSHFLFHIPHYSTNLHSTLYFRYRGQGNLRRNILGSSRVSGARTAENGNI